VLFVQGARQEYAGFSAPDAIEMHSVGVNRTLLEQLATASGGHEITDATGFPCQATVRPAMALWPWLLAWRSCCCHWTSFYATR